MWLIGAIVMLGAILAGSGVWYSETRKLYRKGPEEWPLGMDPLEHEHWVLSRRRRRRLIKTALYAIAGAVATFGLLLAFALRR